nr:iron-sulfur cluster assembly protein [Azorhizobium oxalatiphilum]
MEDDLSGIIEEDLEEEADAGDTVPAPWDEAAVTAEIIEALRTVHDPEIPVNIYDLGLIYRINLLPPFGVELDMTLTAPGCPVAGELVSMVQRAVLTVPQIDVATVRLVFDPPWDSSKMTEDVKLELGLL